MLSNVTVVLVKDQEAAPHNDVTNDFDFVLSVRDLQGTGFPGDQKPLLPTYDPANSNWKIGNRATDNLIPFLDGMEAGPHGSYPNVIVELPADAAIQDYRAAISSLVGMGICRVGVLKPAMAAEVVPPGVENREAAAGTLVPIYEIKNVRNEYGRNRPCRDRFPPWGP